jgi:threonylcarbamoyladenosine tRNA methylthiotransferase MtaB
LSSVGFHTFGCKLNQYETEALASSFREAGHTVAGRGARADLYIVNTCTVTSQGEQKARRMIRLLSRTHPASLIIATGCSAEVEAEALGHLGPNVAVVPQSRKDRLLALPRFLSTERGGEPPGLRIRSFLSAQSAGKADPFRYAVSALSFHTRAWLKVQDGCDARCAYCRVPFARGPAVSLDPAAAVQRAVSLENAGCREIVLTGVNLSSYDSGGLRIAGLLREILEKTVRTRLRLSSLEPEGIDRALLDVLAHPRVCGHFHLSVQSGSDAVLARMRRRYRGADVARAVMDLRAAKEDPFLAADLITGFPGETPEDQETTCAMVRELDVSRLHVFPFSPRPGTAACGLAGRVAEKIRDARAAELRSVSEAQHRGYRLRWLGRSVDVLLERVDPQSGDGIGCSANYLKVRVAASRDSVMKRGRIVSARIVEAEDPCRAELEA